MSHISTQKPSHPLSHTGKQKSKTPPSFPQHISWCVHSPSHKQKVDADRRIPKQLLCHKQPQLESHSQTQSRQLSDTPDDTVSEPHTRTHTNTFKLHQSLPAFQITQHPAPPLLAGFRSQHPGPSRSHLLRLPPPAPSALTLCPGLSSLQCWAPAVGAAPPGANGRREVKQGGLSAHWSLQLPITSTSSGHFLSRLELRGGCWSRVPRTKPVTAFLRRLPKACPPRDSRPESTLPSTQPRVPY